METSEANTDLGSTDSEPRLWVVIDHLSGFYRGTRQILSDPDLEIGSARDATIHFPADHQPQVALHHARITQRNGVFQLVSLGHAPVRVNGNPVDEHLLSHGDLIVVGEHGPVIRFRTYEDPSRPFKSIPEALSDCMDSARAERRSLPGQIWEVIKHTPNEMLRQTAPWTRTLSFGLIGVLVLATGYLTYMSFQFQRELDIQSETLTLAQENRGSMSTSELEDLRSELESRLTETLERVEALEDMSEAGQRIVRQSSRSIAFLIGDYGFVDDEGNVLKTVVDDQGRPVLNRNGRPAVSPEGNGPPFRIDFTGTSFAVDTNGVLLTNRHVVLPWEYDANAKAVMAAGFRPVVNRFFGYLPGMAASFRVGIVAVSDSADLAVLACQEKHVHVPPIGLSEEDASPGDEVIVMGYPTGIRALLARTDARFVSRLLEETKRDFWTIVQRLAEEGHITPLATSGIVGQVSENYVVYDAQTTYGGSGGPVIGRDGSVVAINAAILNDFGGSNLGIPVAWARELVEEALSTSSRSP